MKSGQRLVCANDDKAISPRVRRLKSRAGNTKSPYGDYSLPVPVRVGGLCIASLRFQPPGRYILFLIALLVLLSACNPVGQAAPSQAVVGSCWEPVPAPD